MKKKDIRSFWIRLPELDARYAKRIDMVLTVRDKQHAEIYQLLKNFRSVKVINGYTHNDLINILNGCDLSIVPVLWEDNLPQIAIESVAYGVPVLASSCGGASELTDSGLFRFEGGNSEDMLAKIIHFVDHPEDLEKYWQGHHGLMTMEEHLKQLLPYYGLNTDPAPLQISMQDYSFLVMENQFLENHIAIDGNSMSADVERLRRELNEARDRIERGKNDRRIVEKLNKFLPEGSFRRKIVKKLFMKKEK